MASFRLRIVTVGLLIAGPALNLCLAADCRVWTLTKTERVLRSSPPGNSLQVKLAAARNEWESFQILIRSDQQVNNICVEAGELRSSGGTALDASHARLFRQHQLHIGTGTYRNDTFKPDWYPDPLIPFRHPMSGENLEGTRFKAAPFDLPANETHGFWVDLYIPDNAKPGEYCGIYRVTSASSQSIEIPISLTIWDFTLPRVSTLVTAFGSPAPRMRDYYRQRAKADKEPEPKDWTAIENQCAQLLTEHRINATPPSEYLWPVAQPDGSFRIPAEKLNALREFVDRYHVNALQIPHPDNVVKDPELERDKLWAYLAAFDYAAKELNRPYIIFYTYLKDEPNTEEDYHYVQKWGRAIREAKSIVKVLVVEQTWTEPGEGGADSAWGDLYGAVDIWCPLFSLHKQDSASKRQALGEMVWTYTALCQGEPTPWWHTDYPLLNYRVPAWIAWRYKMKGLLYWGGLSYWREVEDPWIQADTYHDKLVFNGEGSIVYPARAVGYDGIVSSLRLKALRDAIEDYEYLAILEQLGKREEAEKLVLPLAQSWFVWEKDPAKYETARIKLAGLITSASGSVASKGK